jgi:hypothetical protein
MKSWTPIEFVKPRVGDVIDLRLFRRGIKTPKETEKLLIVTDVDETALTFTRENRIYRVCLEYRLEEIQWRLSR